MQQKQKQESKSKSRAGSAIAIITLSILLAITLTLGVTGAFFAGTANVTGDITLGDPVNINITQGGATATSLTFSGASMPGDVFSQKIGVSAPASTSEAVLRAKLTIVNTDGASTTVVAAVPSTWITGEDDYYYYNGTITAGTSVDFVNSITVPKTLTNLDANKTYSITVIVEAIQFANGAASETWTTAPTAWTTAYGSGTAA